MPIRPQQSARLAQPLDPQPRQSARSAPASKAGLDASAGRQGLRQREALYRAALHNHLAGFPKKEIDFFVNPRRFEILERLIGGDLHQPGKDILNVASGPFALEFYLGLEGTRVDSFDREPRLWNLYLELKGRRLIGPSRFEVQDATHYVPRCVFDIVVINDLFYAREIDFYALIGRYIACLKPGGILYFDIQDERAGPVWRAFGKDAQFRRYDLARVKRVLEDAGLVVDHFEPALGIKGPIDRVMRQGLWSFAGIANSYVFVARKPGAR